MSDKMRPYHYDNLEHETDEAWLLRMDVYNIWFPKSQCNINEDEEIIEVPEWLAIEKGLE